MESKNNFIIIKGKEKLIFFAESISLKEFTKVLVSLVD